MTDAHADVAPGTLAVCVFCGAKDGVDPVFRRLATAVGAAIARRGWSVVYGGGGVGLMGALANGALDAGGRVIGVIPEALLGRELARGGLHRLEVVPTMASRKERMVEISDAFVALPGGLGTLDELFEVLTLRQIGVHGKPTALLDYDGYFAPLVEALAHFVRHGFVAPHDVGHLIVGPDADTVLDALADVAAVSGR